MCVCELTSTPATARAVVPNQTDESPRKFRISIAHPVLYAFTNDTHSLTPGTQHDFGAFGFQSVAAFNPQQWNYIETKYEKWVQRDTDYIVA